MSLQFPAQGRLVNDLQTGRFDPIQVSFDLQNAELLAGDVDGYAAFQLLGRETLFAAENFPVDAVDKQIAAAGLDVLEEEPTSPDNPLLDMDNVLITPHLAGLGIEASEKSRAFAAFNTTNVAAGNEAESVVLPE